MSRREARLAGGGIAVVLVAILVFAFVSQPSQAVQPQIVGGSVVLDNQASPIVFDLASGTPTLELAGVGFTTALGNPSQVEAVPGATGTLLVNQSNGDFNFLSPSNILDDTKSPVTFPADQETGPVIGVGAGTNYYTIQGAASGGTIVYLADPSIVQLADSAAAYHVPGKSLPGTVQNLPGTTASADGQLWLLETTGGSDTVVELGPGGSFLKPLHRTPVADSQAPTTAALSTDSPDSVSTHVAVATPNSIRIYSAGDTQPATIPLPGTTGTVKSIVPVSGTDGEVLFLYESDTSVSLVGVQTGSDTLIGPRTVTGLGQGESELISPALNDGFVYTMSGGSEQARLLRIDAASGAASPLPGVSTLPRESDETDVPSNANIQIVSDGPRVIFNDSNRAKGVVAFTDSTLAVKTFDKGRAQATDPSEPGGITQTPQAQQPKAQPDQPQQPKAQPTVNLQQDCKDSNQQPRQPVITALQPAAKDVEVTWSYTPVNQTDCTPSSYIVTATLVGNGQGPDNPSVDVQGQLSVDFPGLHPDTQYKFVVTAEIGTHTADSLPMSTTTTLTGPDAPSSVTAQDSDGTGWQVDWNPCSGNACNSVNDTPVLWTVTGQVCGGGFVGTSLTTTVQAGGPTSASFSFGDYPALVGDSFQFQVRGVDQTGNQGSPAQSGCTEGWAKPVASDMSLVQSDFTPDGAGNYSTTLSVQLASGSSAAQAFGSAKPQFVFSVLSGGQPTSIGGVPSGPVSTPSIDLKGLPLDSLGQYTASVSVYPSGHQGDAVQLPPVPLQSTTSWPSDDAITVTEANTTANATDLNFALSDVFTDIPSASSVTVAGSLNCGAGNNDLQIAPLAVSRAGGSAGIATLPAVSLINYGGACNVTVTASVASGTNPHSGASPVLTSAPFQLGGSQPTPTVTISWAGGSAPTTGSYDIVVSVAGSGGIATTWTATATGPADTPTDCTASTSLTPSSDGTTLTGTIDLSTCVGSAVQPGQPARTLTYGVNLTWSYLGDPSAGPVAAATSLTTGSVSPAAEVPTVTIAFPVSGQAGTPTFTVTVAGTPGSTVAPTGKVTLTFVNTVTNVTVTTTIDLASSGTGSSTASLTPSPALPTGTYTVTASYTPTPGSTTYSAATTQLPAPVYTQG